MAGAVRGAGHDEFGNPLPGVTVRWTILSGGGELSHATSATDNTGRATVTYRLPALPGTARIRADIAGTTVRTTFTAIAEEPPTASSRR